MQATLLICSASQQVDVSTRNFVDVGKLRLLSLLNTRENTGDHRKLGVAWNTVSSFKFKTSQCADSTPSGGNVPCDQVQKYYQGTEGLRR